MESWQVDILQTAEGQQLLCQERFLVSVCDLILKAMSEQGVTRKELARRIGKTPGRVTQLLSGDANLTLRTLADVFHALGQTIVIGAGENSEFVELDLDSVSWGYCHQWPANPTLAAWSLCVNAELAS